MSEQWISLEAGDVQAGDRVRMPTGKEFDVARVDRPFLGMDNLVCLIESNDERWFAQPVPIATGLEVLRSS
jgi:hypothetical protein